MSTYPSTINIHINLPSTNTTWVEAEPPEEISDRPIGVYTGKTRRDPTYLSWLSMRSRCNNPKNKSYPNYGGRGIVVCKRWDKFKTFLADMTPRPSRDYSLERVDNNGPYDPGNCKWILKAEQQLNTRRSRKLTLNGETRSLCEWTRLTGISSNLILRRINTFRWTVEDALTKPVEKKYAHDRGGRFILFNERKRAAHAAKLAARNQSPT
ncbi:MAG: hypothetical protein EOO77_07405 [Oxalobacteraceae bacterium]|nr:MAG: hypothetical protein EOO77_07405 [Oxalobacteraceae bacterium]